MPPQFEQQSHGREPVAASLVVLPGSLTFADIMSARGTSSAPWFAPISPRER